MFLSRISLLACLTTFGCATGAGQSGVSSSATDPAGGSMAANQTQSGAETGPLGSVDGEPIGVADFDDDVQGQLRDLANEKAQRRWTLLWVGFEQEIADRLLEAEAARQKRSVEQLLGEVAKTVSASDEDVRGFYEQNKQMIPVPFEEARDTIREQMSSQLREEALRDYVEQLRGKAKIEYSLPVPELPRFPVEAGDAPSAGAKDAKVTIVEFSDFQCPYCSQAHEVLGELKKTYGDKIRLVYRDFPLAQHAAARPAAEAAKCAHEQGKFWAYHDILFDNSETLKAENLEAYAVQAKLDEAAFASCLASGRAAEAVRADEAAARKFGVAGTPAIFINGIKLIGLLPMPLLQSLIDSELSDS